MNDQNGNGPAKPMIMPDNFIAPHKMPVHVDVTFAADDNGSGWVIVRTETVHGSHVAFLDPTVAENLAKDLADVAPRARLAVFDT